MSDNAVIERSSVILPSKTSLYQSDSSFKSISGFHQSKTNQYTCISSTPTFLDGVAILIRINDLSAKLSRRLTKYDVMMLSPGTRSTFLR